jgi:hypothetical protein
VFYLWPEHQAALVFWGVVGDQWRVDGEGRKHSLDHAAVEAGMRMHGVPEADRPDLYEAMRIMARAAAEAWARQRSLASMASGVGG